MISLVLGISWYHRPRMHDISAQNSQPHPKPRWCFFFVPISLAYSANLLKSAKTFGILLKKKSFWASVIRGWYQGFRPTGRKCIDVAVGSMYCTAILTKTWIVGASQGLNTKYIGCWLIGNYVTYKVQFQYHYQRRNLFLRNRNSFSFFPQIFSCFPASWGYISC